jgi:hypothetical protein
MSFRCVGSSSSTPQRRRHHFRSLLPQLSSQSGTTTTRPNRGVPSHAGTFEALPCVLCLWCAILRASSPLVGRWSTLFRVCPTRCLRDASAFTWAFLREAD